MTVTNMHTAYALKTVFSLSRDKMLNVGAPKDSMTERGRPNNNRSQPNWLVNSTLDSHSQHHPGMTIREVEFQFCPRPYESCELQKKTPCRGYIGECIEEYYRNC